MECRRHMDWSKVVDGRTERRGGVHEEDGCVRSFRATTTVSSLSNWRGWARLRARNVVRDWSGGRSKGPRTETNSCDQKTYFHPCHRRRWLCPQWWQDTTMEIMQNIATWDVSRAHFYGEFRRWIYSPVEDCTVRWNVWLGWYSWSLTDAWLPHCHLTKRSTASTLLHCRFNIKSDRPTEYAKIWFGVMHI